MWSNLSYYKQPIMAALFGFPIVAGLFTIPFMVGNYRKYGGIALMRVIVVYSFILYSMCAFLLTMLPLPSREAVAAAAPKPILWVPLTDLLDGLEHTGFDLNTPSTLLSLELWRRYLSSKDFFQIAANIVMQVPLGFYLRYYFRCSFRKTVLIGLLVSLFYELTQLTGLWFIYPQAYRFASVDDLINNTLGAAVGYGITPLLALVLPSREEIDRISYRKGENLTLIRRMFAAVLDVIMVMIIEGTVIQLEPWLAEWMDSSIRLQSLWVFPMYFVVIPWITGGRTLGQGILRIRIVRSGGQCRPNLWQLLIRNVFLYIVEPLLGLMAVMALGGAVLVLAVEELDWVIRLLLVIGESVVLLGVSGFFLHSQLRWNTFPHGRFSRTECVLDKQLKAERKDR